MSRGKFLLRPTRRPEIEAIEAESRHVFSRHTHEQFGIGVIERGAQSSLSGRGMVDAGAGDLITVNPGEVHDGMPIGDQGRCWKMLYFDPTLVIATVADIVGRGNDCEFRYPVRQDAGAAAAFARLYRIETGTTHGPQIESESLLLSLVADLISERRTEPKFTIPGSIRRAKDLIDDQPTEDLMLADLAIVSGLSRFQVLRGFTRATGLSPHGYLMQKRTHLARQLIRDGLSLADVAAASGFADQSHMTRTFVSKYGITPGAYATAIA